MTEQEHARAIAEQQIEAARKLHLMLDRAGAEWSHAGSKEHRDCYPCSLIIAALSSTADTARAQGELELLKQFGSDDFRQHLHCTFSGGWHGNEDGMIAFHHGMDTVCNLLAEKLRARATSGDTP